jgi:hypothetical protein
LQSDSVWTAEVAYHINFYYTFISKLIFKLFVGGDTDEGRKQNGDDVRSPDKKGRRTDENIQCVTSVVPLKVFYYEHQVKSIYIYIQFEKIGSGIQPLD